MIDVVAAVIKKNNKYLIAQRNKNKHLAYYWEFPGGKVDINENFEQALKREILEELNLKINIKNKITSKKHQDEKINVEIHYFVCDIFDGDIILSEHEDVKWVHKQDLLNYKMAPGDFKIINYLI